MNADESSKDSELFKAEEVFKAEIVDDANAVENVSAENPAVGGMDRVSPTTGVPMSEFSTLEDPQKAPAAPVKNLWDQGIQREQSEKKQKVPFLQSTFNTRVGFLIASMVSIVFLVAFFVLELRGGTHRAIIVRQSMWMGFVLIFSIGGFLRIQPTYAPNDARWISWTALIASVVCYLFVISTDWKWICFGWMLFQILPVIGIAFAPRPRFGDDRIEFDVNDSLAANGGAVAAVVLGVWSILGSLFTSLSVINSLLGIMLGAWGLSSRKKVLAVFGIGLCVLGVLSCLLNVTSYFWELITIPEEELLGAE